MRSDFKSIAPASFSVSDVVHCGFALLTWETSIRKVSLHSYGDVGEGTNVHQRAEAVPCSRPLNLTIGIFSSSSTGLYLVAPSVLICFNMFPARATQAPNYSVLVSIFYI